MTAKRIKRIQEKYTEPRSKKTGGSASSTRKTEEVILIKSDVSPNRMANSEMLAIAVVIVTIFYFATEYFLPKAALYPSNVDLLADMGLIVATLFSVFWIISRARSAFRYFQNRNS